MLKFAVISLKYAWEENCVYASAFQRLDLFSYIRKSWTFIRAFIRQYRIDENFMNLHFSTLGRMDNVSAFDIFHIKHSLIEYLRSRLLIFGNVQNFINCLFTINSCKIKNPVIKSTFLKFTERVLNPQVWNLISVILIKFRLMEWKVIMIILRIKAWGFQANYELLSVFWVLDEVIDSEILSTLANDWFSEVITLPVVWIIVAVEELNGFLGIIFPSKKTDQESLQFWFLYTAVN